jgi:hypothetical protein
MLTIRHEGAVVLDNEHRNISQNMDAVALLEEDWQDALVPSLQQRGDLLGEFIHDQVTWAKSLCPTGAVWSQSGLFRSRATQVVTERDQAIWEIPADALHSSVTKPAEHFVMVAGGTRIATLVSWLEHRGLSLRTAGSHKGQAVAGMFATGAHGSALEETGFDGHVRGMLMACGRDSSFWLEDPDNKVLTDDFTAQFGQAGPHAHFRDALIHLGGMGLVNAVLLEVVPEFLLGSSQVVEPLPVDCLDQLSAGDFNSAMAHISHGQTPFFYELTFDPFRPTGDVAQLAYVHASPSAPRALTELHIKDPIDHICEHGLDESSMDTSKMAYADEAPEGGDNGYQEPRGLVDLGQIVLDKIREEEHFELNAGWPFARMLKKWEPRTVGPFRINTYNAAFAVPLDRLAEVMEIGFESARINNFKRYFVYTVRFAKQSPATLSFLRWERCAIINVDGLEKRWSSHADRAAKAFTTGLTDAKIPFSMHWGKDAPSDSEKILADFPDAVAGWQVAREAMLTSKTQRRFTSPALEHWGLVD